MSHAAVIVGPVPVTHLPTYRNVQYQDCPLGRTESLFYNSFDFMKHPYHKQYIQSLLGGVTSISPANSLSCHIHLWPRNIFVGDVTASGHISRWFWGVKYSCRQLSRGSFQLAGSSRSFRCVLFRELSTYWSITLLRFLLNDVTLWEYVFCVRIITKQSLNELITS